MTDLDQLADGLLDKIVERLVDDPEAVAKYLETLEERLDEYREERERFVPSVQAVDPTLTVKPTVLRRAPQPVYDDTEKLGMVIAKSFSSIGAARDWVNSTEGWSSPYSSDTGLLVLKENNVDSGFWIGAGQVLVYGTYGFSSNYPGTYDLENAEEGTDDQE